MEQWIKILPRHTREIPDANTNQLKTDMYSELAEYCVAYIKDRKAANRT